MEQSLDFLSAAIFYIQFHVKLLTAFTEYVIKIRELPYVAAYLCTVVLLQGIQYLSDGILIPEYGFQQPDQHQCRKAGGKVGFNVFVCPYINRSGPEKRLCDLKRVLNPGQSPVDVPDFCIAQVQFTGDNGVVAVVFCLFGNLFLVQFKISSIHNGSCLPVKGDVFDIG